jgi:hypothetical protein
MRGLVRAAAALSLALCVLTAQAARAETLDIEPVVQQTPVWCWAATSEMVLKHYGFPNLNPAGNYQCGVVGSVGGPCWSNCGACITSGGTTYSIANVLRNYARVTLQLTGFRVDEPFEPRAVGRLSPGQIERSIDDDAPVVAGITPAGIRFPPGMGFSQHAVLIVGYEEAEDGGLFLVVNDPYPYPYGVAPYVQAGGASDGPGRFLIRYEAFVQRLGYDNSIVF